MPYKSNLPNVTTRIQRARYARVIAASEVVLEYLKDEHLGGYTSGNFVTGRVLNSLVRSDPAVVDGALVVRVTTNQTDPPYPVYWTLGHVNLFTGKFERVDHWTPAIAKAAGPAVAAGDRAALAVMGGR